MRARLFTPENRKWWTLVAVAIGLFMIMLDNTVVNVALPSIQRDLGIGISELEWVVNAYALTFGVLLLTGGKLADLLGRRAIFITGLVIFTGSALWCVDASVGAVRDRSGSAGRVRVARTAPAPPDARSLAVPESDVRRRQCRDAAGRARDVRDLLLQLAPAAGRPRLQRDRDRRDVPAADRSDHPRRSDRRALLRPCRRPLAHGRGDDSARRLTDPLRDARRQIVLLEHPAGPARRRRR